MAKSQSSIKGPFVRHGEEAGGLMMKLTCEGEANFKGGFYVIFEDKVRVWGRGKIRVTIRRPESAAIYDVREVNGNFGTFFTVDNLARLAIKTDPGSELFRNFGEIYISIPISPNNPVNYGKNAEVRLYPR